MVMKHVITLTFCSLFLFFEIRASDPFNFTEDPKTGKKSQFQEVCEPYLLYEAVVNDDENVEVLLNHLWQINGAYFEPIKKAFNKAIKLNNLKIVKLFMEKAGVTPEYALFQITGQGKTEILKYIIQKKPKNLNNALLQAVQYKCLTDVRTLMDNGANDLNLPLLAACAMGYLDIVKFLVKKGAKNLNEAMVVAAIGNQLHVIKHLTTNGAYNLEEALEETEEGNNQIIIDYLKKEIEKRTLFMKIDRLENKPQKPLLNNILDGIPQSTALVKKPPVKIGARKFKLVKYKQPKSKKKNN